MHSLTIDGYHKPGVGWWRADASEFKNDWLDDLGPDLFLNASACASPNATMGRHAECKTSLKRQGRCPFTGLHWDKLAAQWAVRSKEWAVKYKAAGGALDYMSQDTEIGEGGWSSVLSSEAAPLACRRARWA